MGWLIASAIWGFGEATLFFIIPDVILTAIAIRSLRKALIACACALAGALIGGTLMYCWGMQSPEEAATAVDQVPLVSAVMITDVRTDLRQDGVIALVTGPINGTPYKIYAVSAHQSNISYPKFIAASTFARTARFVVTSLIAWALSRYALYAFSLRTKYLILATVWTLIYVSYTVANL